MLVVTKLFHFSQKSFSPVLTNYHACVHAQLCLTLLDLMDCNLPGSSVYGIFQSRILEWVAISFSRGSSQLEF